MKRYTRLTLAEREEISRQVAVGVSVRAMARQLGRAPSTISRELHRATLTPRTYRAAAAHREVTTATHTPRRPRKLAINRRLQAYVHAQLAQRWSPEPMAKRLRTEAPEDATMRVSHETSSTILYVLPRGELRRELLAALRHRRKHRKSRRTSHDRRGVIPDMISIEERPAEVAARTVSGHWRAISSWVAGMPRRWAPWWNGPRAPRSWCRCGRRTPRASVGRLPARCVACHNSCGGR